MYDNLHEAYLNIYNEVDNELHENVSGGRGSRARSGTGSGRAPIAQRVTASQAAEIRDAAKRKSTPEPESKPRQKRKGVKVLPSGGVEAKSKVLRGGYGRTPHGIATRRATELTNRSRRLDVPMSDTLSSIKRSEKIKAALKKYKKWGTPQANEEFVLEYLVQEGYTNSYDSAELILESMSDNWICEILSQIEDEI